MKIVFIYFVSIFNLACSASKNSNFDAKTEIKSITARQWIAGAKGGGGGVVLDMYLKTEVDSSFIPTKIQYQDREGILTKVKALHYQANIITMNNMDETLPTPTIKTNLKPTEARIFFNFNNKEQSFTFANVKELEVIPYPSAKPNNE
jgi:hypothetical protein